MFFYDTCSLLNNYDVIFKNIDASPFVISNITLGELEEIKTSKFKDDDIKFKAKKVSQLLNFYYGNYTIVNYNRDWDQTYLEPNPILMYNNDSRIVISAYVYAENHPDISFVTDDVNLNNTAKSIGLSVVPLFSKEDKEYTGYKVIPCFNDNDISEVYSRIYANDSFDLLENQYLVIQQVTQQDDKIITKDIDAFVYRNNKLEQVQFYSFNSRTFGEVKPLDLYQRLAMDSLSHNRLTMIRGAAGTGKSYLSIGFLFDKLESGEIDKIVIFCNPVATAKSAKLGFYPGSRTEKLLDSQIGNFLISKLGDRIAVERLIAEGSLILLPMADIRGFDTTGMRAGVYITEAQNLDIDLMKLALQRIGDDGICILDGDSDTQVDLGSYAGVNNGMRRVSKIFKGEDIYGETTLPICHRSRIAAIAEKM